MLRLPAPSARQAFGPTPTPPATRPARPPALAVLQRTAGNAALQGVVVVQRKPSHVVDYLKTLLREGDPVIQTFVTTILELGTDPSVRGWTPDATGLLTKTIAQAFIDDSTKPRPYRLRFYELWNRGQKPADKATLPADLGGKPLVVDPDQTYGFDDSGDEAVGVDDLVAEIKSASTDAIELCRTTKHTSLTVPVLPFGLAELMGRRIIKTCRRENLTFNAFLPLAGAVGDQLFEFDVTMNGLDIFAYPLYRLDDATGGDAPPGPSLKRKATSDLAHDPASGAPPAKLARYGREGSTGSHKWSDIAKGLAREATDPEVAKANIFSVFLGFGDPVDPTPFQNLAIAAIGCDFMKGYEASLEFVRIAVANPETSPLLLFAGSAPIYKPAGSEGRGLVVARQDQLRRAAFGPGAAAATAPAAAPPTATAPAAPSNTTAYVRTDADPTLVVSGASSSPTNDGT